jgi:7,8-dihydropterin-6-yl-methyl-4-(beta-D-ribofuranosyl)aminobenzene 5'-phosphate synthase
VNFKITTLVENSVPIEGSKKLIGEHGLAFLIETGDRKILFDTGQNLALVNNAKILGIELEKIDSVVLSHGHYDHSGGLKSLLECNSIFSLYAHPDVFIRKFKEAKGKYKDIGIPVTKEDLEKRGVTLKLDEKSMQITSGLMTTGEVSLETDFESVASGFYIEQANKMLPDTLADDLALILSTKKGILILLGCSHRGVINTLNQVQKQTGSKKIYAILGGLHLAKVSNAKLTRIINHLRGFHLEKIGVGHCTGTRAIHALYNEFHEKVFLNAVGNVIIT